MAHTYNEQVLTIAAGETLEETAGLIRSGIAELTGWVQDSGETEYLNITSDKKLRFRVYINSSYIYFRVYFNSTIMLQGNSTAQRISNAATTFRCHKSTDETVTWLGCDNENAMYWLVANNDRGIPVVFSGYITGAMVVGTDVLNSQRYYYYRNSSGTGSTPGYTNCISIARFADMWNGGSFPELFFVYGITEGYASENFHVAFGDKTYALVKMHNSNAPSQYIFAFPVSDGE